MYALADCNNFFVSCERVFRPDLEGRPVVVLSNNDGCAIARSNEAKRLGIKMGQPMFEFRPPHRVRSPSPFSLPTSPSTETCPAASSRPFPALPRLSRCIPLTSHSST